MNYYKFIYLTWLIPLCFLFLFCQQGAVYVSIKNTYKSGTSYNAQVEHYNYKQIATLTSGHVVLQFHTKNKDTIRKSLSLPVEMAAQIHKMRVVPVRYQPGAFESTVIIKTFKTQKSLAWTNMAMAFVGLAITFFIALAAHRYAGKKIKYGDEELVIERVD